METLSERQEPAPGCPPSLDKGYTSARQSSGRCYHRVISGLEKGGQLRLLTLTTASQSQNKTFQKHFRMLRMRLLRRRLLLDYIRCPELTKSGLRHEHILFRGDYIMQAYLSHLWAEIHGAPVVDIRRAYGRRQLAGYMANYMTKAIAGRYSYSWGWVWKGFTKDWKALKAFWRQTSWGFDNLLTFWKECIRLGERPDGWVPI